MAKMNRKKALDAMVKAHASMQTDILIRLNAEGLKTDALFPHREEMISKILNGVDPVSAVDDAVGAAIRLHRVSMTANTNVPSFRDLMSEEDRKLLQTM